ncbi:MULTISPECIES: alpha/beta fold hydrolase [unclassified Modicisalibacter]|uniref:alpha/beta hydrolase n=1 Tax=unclassified Modicisalibacter TaxID=2679913 RepID=UPI001CCFB326|nr:MULTISPECIES: alpha/beta fold hydrolase [unclassified Modicisalibacter]MBZ9559672.1 alpha/beta fold hydrolase [Modicisalibacter sp. R2A 31.J]MBZ9577124.1 alpha/beta fold hydrolase [Modicisalibacter sp. MOD 31.J]
MKLLLIAVLLIVIGLPVAVVLALLFGGPSSPPVAKGITEPFKALDDSDLPAPSHYPARDGSQLAFRHYPPHATAQRGSVVLLHGSSATSWSLHPLARAYADAGYAAYALDVRGHGGSGTRGVIDHVGQLEEDLEDFMQAVAPAAPTTLVGFSAGGGFALRVAGGRYQGLFDHYLLLAPFIGQDAPTYRHGSGGWVRVGIPRYLAILLLNRLGIHAFDHLPVVRYALNDEAKAALTPWYAFNLAQNYRPERGYRATIAAVQRPMHVLVGEQDPVFHVEHFDAVFRDAGSTATVELLPGIDHVGLVLEPRAIDAAIDATRDLHRHDKPSIP